MGREIRRVPAGWEHPTDEQGEHIPLLKSYDQDIAYWKNHPGGYSMEDWFGRIPDRSEYMPEWTEEEKTHIQLYQNTSEGTPLTPPFKTPEELARCAADTGVSAFGRETATYEEWLAMARQGYSVGLVVTTDAEGKTDMRSGVAHAKG